MEFVLPARTSSSQGTNFHIFQKSGPSALANPPYQSERANRRRGKRHACTQRGNPERSSESPPASGPGQGPSRPGGNARPRERTPCALTRRRDSFPYYAGLKTRHLINASSKDKAERTSTTRSAASEPVAHRESLPAGRATIARSAPPRSLSSILQFAMPLSFPQPPSSEIDTCRIQSTDCEEQKELSQPTTPGSLCTHHYSILTSHSPDSSPAQSPR
jgi:hypothetical protein